MTRWYCVMTAPNSEAKADAEIRRLGCRTFFPFERVKSHRAGRTARMRIEWLTRPYFSRYVFVAFDGRPAESFVDIEAIPEVASFVRTRFTRQPLVIPEGIMDMLDSAIVRFEESKGQVAALMRERVTDAERELQHFINRMGRRQIARKAA